MTAPPQPDPAWKPMGRTSNTQFFLAGSDVLVAIPDPGLKDNATTAHENAAFQVGVAKQLDRPLGLIVHMTSMLSQDADARKVFGEEIQAPMFRGVALIVTNPLSRAIGSFSLGLARPKVPTRLVANFEDGVAWLKSLEVRPPTSNP